MRLIGLDIRYMDASIQKVLKSGWYPFGNFDPPSADGIVKVPDVSHEERSIYRLRKDQPTVNVSCIVGRNGSGKSTLLDLLYRILNNIAVKLSEESNQPIKSEIEFAYGVYADLYCEIDNYVNIIRCQDSEMSYSRYNFKHKKAHKENIPLVFKNARKLLGQLFYTIGINYSIYAFNKNDYTSQIEQRINGEWLNGVFHKNDGYFAPLTLVPFREDGNISVQKEHDLALQRITALAILSRAKQRQFPEGYIPRMLHYELNEKFRDSKLARFKNNYQPILPDKVTIDELVESFESSWRNKLDSENISLAEWSENIVNLTVFYLAYKSLKICLTYNDYYALIGMDALKEKAESHKRGFQKYKERELKERIDNVVSVLYNKKDHITLKIHQCIKFITTWHWRDDIQVPVDDVITAYQPVSYDEVVECIPPPFFDVDVTFKQVPQRRIKGKEPKVWNGKAAWDNDAPWGDGGVFTEPTAWSDDKGATFRLSSMSSGERQMLVVLSYVLYHIKNLQSVEDTNYRVAYHHVNLVFDEAELYFHPDYQRRFLSMLIEGLSWSKIDRRRIRSIHILVATHSPFVLTDILTEHTLYLSKGDHISVSKQTFGGNYYDLLDSSFFFDKTAIGEVSARALRRWIHYTRTHHELPPGDAMKMIGDPFILRYLKAKTSEADNVQDTNTDC